MSKITDYLNARVNQAEASYLAEQSPQAIAMLDTQIATIKSRQTGRQMAKPVLSKGGNMLKGAWEKFSPELKQKATEEISARLNGQTPVAAIAQAVKGDSSAIAGLLSAMASSGRAPEAVLTNTFIDEMRMAGHGAIIDEARKAFVQAYAGIDAQSMLKATTDLGQELFYRGVLDWAISTFGRDARAIKRNHVMLRSFLEMNEQALDNTLTLHRVK